jgi:hypothetical protein
MPEASQENALRAKRGIAPSPKGEGTSVPLRMRALWLWRAQASEGMPDERSEAFS